ncbi:MAG TPA: HisA/HisF-related TIM barrel protein [Lautropia sp.]|nr:HisA/HisF-related TIM barrel protein [Lautropia sp.]
MQIVPVVDLLAGHAVRAVRGDRANYQPVESSLCRGSDPLVVGRALLDHCAGNTLYIADLDALTGRGVQTPLLTELLQALPEVGIWLDAGFASPPEAAAILGALPEGGKRVVPVIASEALSAAESISEFTRRWPRALLSLDQRQGKALGAESCWTASHLWPQKIIVMTLDRVGSFEGPDLATVQEVQARAGSARTVIGAGGVRSVADLEAAARAGVEAWLIASALHDGRIPAGWFADH